MAHVRIVYTHPLLVGEVKRTPGDIFARLEFPDSTQRAYFLANFRWPSFRADLCDAPAKALAPVAEAKVKTEAGKK